MKVPKSGREISKEWVEHILKEHRAASNPPAFLRVDTCTVCEEPGDGFNSLVIFFSVETTEKDEVSSPETKKVHHLVAKFLIQDPSIQMMHKKMKTNLREYLVYTDLIGTMNKMLSAKAPQEHPISVPKLIYGKCTNKEFVLVMENLRYAGYEKNDKRKGLNTNQLKAAIDQLARFHALSYVFCQSADMSKYSCFRLAQEYLNRFIIMMMGVVLEPCISFLKMSKETEELGKKIESCKSTLLEKVSACVLYDYSVKCLTHGDFWNDNIMFKYADDPDGQKIIEEVKIIDWGNSSLGTPILDLQYLVHTSTTLTVRKNHLDEVLNHYHSSFMRLTTLLGSPPDNWTLEQLKKEWKQSYSVGFILGAITTQGTLSTTHPVNKKPEPSLLDKPMLLPLKVIVDGMKMGVAKVAVPLSLSSAGQKLFAGFMRKMVKPILEELKSGKNEILNTRLLELIKEADENGLFIA